MRRTALAFLRRCQIKKNQASTAGRARHIGGFCTYMGADEKTTATAGRVLAADFAPRLWAVLLRRVVDSGASGAHVLDICAGFCGQGERGVRDSGVARSVSCRACLAGCVFGCGRGAGAAVVLATGVCGCVWGVCCGKQCWTGLAAAGTAMGVGRRVVRERYQTAVCFVRVLVAVLCTDRPRSHGECAGRS